VPTHFAKVVLTSRPISPSSPLLSEVSTGAFVLPNAPIPEDTPLQGFVVPVEAVEKAAGLQLFSEEVKKVSKHVCQTAQCQLVVRRFDDAQKQQGNKNKGPKAIAAPRTS
jgi:endonuclease G